KSIEHCLQTDDLPGAVEQLTQGLVHHPDDLELLNALGNFHYQTGRAEAALAAFQRKVELQPENPENHLQVAGAGVCG
ncbi:MAG: tetratricopeptide repeat protein, partial [Limisphaerales bacterium]